MGTPLLQINNLTVSFEKENNSFTAIKNLNLSVCRGEIRALVGESGSGKSVTSMSILQLIPAHQHPIKMDPFYFIIPKTNASTY
jgi:peptide/nickel transport system ATP-binding protein